MASELKVDKFTGVTTAGSILVTGEGNSTTTSLQQGLAKVWFFTETLAQADASDAVDDSFNVSSFTDDETGQMACSFTNNMNAVNYPTVANASGGSADDNITTNYGGSTTPAWTTGSTNFLVNDGAYKDQALSAMIKGDLA
tara:strand:+ start:357 stop:779 length:423 start_codon:yes stop_codon:yes gene_type:complete